MQVYLNWPPKFTVRHGKDSEMQKPPAFPDPAPQNLLVQ